jgi:hypothetical protein
MHKAAVFLYQFELFCVEPISVDVIKAFPAVGAEAA